MDCAIHISQKAQLGGNRGSLEVLVSLPSSVSLWSQGVKDHVRWFEKIAFIFPDNCEFFSEMDDRRTDD